MFEIFSIIWIGPPPAPKNKGQDVNFGIHVAKLNTHGRYQINFYCLDKFVPHYLAEFNQAFGATFFNQSKIAVHSIEKYLAQESKELGPALQKDFRFIFSSFLQQGKRGFVCAKEFFVHYLGETVKGIEGVHHVCDSNHKVNPDFNFRDRFVNTLYMCKLEYVKGQRCRKVLNYEEDGIVDIMIHSFPLKNPSPLPRLALKHFCRDWSQTQIIFSKEGFSNYYHMVVQALPFNAITNAAQELKERSERYPYYGNNQHCSRIGFWRAKAKRMNIDNRYEIDFKEFGAIKEFFGVHKIYNIRLDMPETLPPKAYIKGLLSELFVKHSKYVKDQELPPNYYYFDTFNSDDDVKPSSAFSQQAKNLIVEYCYEPPLTEAEMKMLGPDEQLALVKFKLKKIKLEEIRNSIQLILFHPELRMATMSLREGWGTAKVAEKFQEKFASCQLDEMQVIFIEFELEYKRFLKERGAAVYLSRPFKHYSELLTRAFEDIRQLFEESPELQELRTNNHKLFEVLKQETIIKLTNLKHSVLITDYRKLRDQEINKSLDRIISCANLQQLYLAALDIFEGGLELFNKTWEEDAKVFENVLRKIAAQIISSIPPHFLPSDKLEQSRETIYNVFMQEGYSYSNWRRLPWRTTWLPNKCVGLIAEYAAEEKCEGLTRRSAGPGPGPGAG